MLTFLVHLLRCSVVVFSTQTERLQFPVAFTTRRLTHALWGLQNEEQLQCCELNGRSQIREFITTFVAVYMNLLVLTVYFNLRAVS